MCPGCRQGSWQNGCLAAQRGLVQRFWGVIAGLIQCAGFVDCERHGAYLQIRTGTFFITGDNQ